jgi:RHS repeat-associated protein
LQTTFTGHKHNNDIGLIYMNARYYLPYINRFLSADTIIPDPTNPQSFNRYSYVLNRPLNFTDPTGHCEFGFDENDQEIITRFDCSLGEFDAMSIEDREKWMRIFMRQIRGAENWFNSIEGIIEGFVEYGLAESGSWLSIVDAAILQGIQDGYTMAAGVSTYYSTHPGASLWSDFFIDLWAGRSDSELISRWGIAETASTNYGIGVATGRNVIPNAYERFFLLTGNLYRSAAASSPGGFGTPVSFITSVIGGLSGLDSDLSVDAGYNLGSFFNDPRSLWNGHSPVYWYSILIWENMATHQWP